MKKLMIIAVLAAGVLAIQPLAAQKIVKDASGNIYLDVSDMLAGTFSTSSMNKIGGTTNADNGLYKRIQIAKNDISGMTWAEMCGIDTKYNSANAIGQLQGQLSTGCKAYNSEGNTGLWRVPTINELRMLWILKPALILAGANFGKNYYRSSTQSNESAVIGNALNSWWISWFTGVTGVDLGNTDLQCYVRCVREIK